MGHQRVSSMNSIRPRSAGRQGVAGSAATLGALAVVVASVLLRPSAIGPEPSASSALDASASPSSAAASTDTAPSVSVRRDISGAAQDVLDGVIVADIDESKVVGGEWVLVTGGPAWIPTRLPGLTSTIRTTGRVVAATTRTDAGWTAGLVDPAKGTYEPILDVEQPGDWWIQASADPAGETLVVVGSGTAGSKPLDLGLLIVRVADGTTTTLTPGVLTRGFRSELEWSASGQTVASSDCDMDVCRVDVVQPATSSLVSIEDLAPLAIGDEVILGIEMSRDFLWRVVDIKTGSRTVVPGSNIAGAFDGYEAAPGMFIISGRTVTGGFTVELFDSVAGTTRSVYEQASDEAYLYALSSNPGWATIGGRGGLVDIVVGRQGLDLLDLSTGAIERDVLSVEWPEDAAGALP